jgi:hypothetical protein
MNLVFIMLESIVKFQRQFPAGTIMILPFVSMEAIVKKIGGKNRFDRVAVDQTMMDSTVNTIGEQFQIVPWIV